MNPVCQSHVPGTIKALQHFDGATNDDQFSQLPLFAYFPAWKRVKSVMAELWGLSVIRCNDLSCSCCLCIVSLFCSILEKSRRSWWLSGRLFRLDLNDVDTFYWLSCNSENDKMFFERAAEISIHSSDQSDSCCLLDTMLNLKLCWPGKCNPSKTIYVD